MHEVAVIIARLTCTRSKNPRSSPLGILNSPVPFDVTRQSVNSSSDISTRKFAKEPSDNPPKLRHKTQQFEDQSTADDESQ